MELVSHESERSVIGALLISGRAYDRAAEIVSAESFAVAANAAIWRACAELANAGQPRDIVTVAEHLEAAGQLEEAGGMGYLGDLAASIPSAANVVAYAEIVRDRALARQIAAAAGDCVEIAQGQGSAAEKLDAAQARFMTIEAGRAAGGLREMRDVLPEVIDRIDERFNSGEEIAGLSTGYDDLDTRINGLEPGNLYIIAGRPSMGKTTLALNIAEHIAQDNHACVFSLEMPSEQLATRSIASLGRVSHARLRTGRLEEADWPRVTTGVQRVEGLGLHIDDSTPMTAAGISSRARAAKRKHGLDLVVVDYLQLMSADLGRRDGNRTQEIGAMSRAMKLLAKELAVPVVLLSQLNRSLEQRQDKRPIMSDLRESGDIEQDADVIMFVYRDEVYHPDSHDTGTAEVIVRKQRNGELGTTRLIFRGEYSRFDNMAISELEELNQRRQDRAAKGYRYEPD